MTEIPQEIDYQKRAVVLVVSAFALRLLYAAFFAINPIGDEAYYWDWGRQLDYGYFSKPPFIAWIYAFVDWIGQGSLFSIRATAAAIGTLSVLLFFKMVESMFDARTGWYAVLLSLAAPANSVLSFFLTIDAPLMLCWTIALWMLWRYVAGEGRTGTLVLLFLSLAIGHLSKQMMMIFPLLAVLFLSTHRETRPFLRRPALWFVLLGSYLSLIPPLVWNARHGWITFKHTSHHFEVHSDGGNVLLQRLGDFSTFLGTQFGVLSPVAAFALFSISLSGLTVFTKTSRPVRFLLTFAAIPLSFMLLLALRQELQPNWPAVFYIAGIALTAAWYSGKFALPFPPTAWRRFFPWAIIVGGIMTLMFYLAPLYFKAIGQPGHQLDPNRRLLGHDKVAAQFEVLRRSLPQADDLFLVAVGHRDLTSFLAFRLPDQPRVYQWDQDGRISSQYEIWNNPAQDGFTGKDGLILVPRSPNVPDSLRNAFEDVEKIGEFTVTFGYGVDRPFTVFLARNLKFWPREETQSDPGDSPPL